MKELCRIFFLFIMACQPVSAQLNDVEASDSPMFAGISEIIVVVHDLDASMQRQWEDFGIGPWEVWTFNNETTSSLTMHGEKYEGAFRIAYTKIGNTYWELVQPLDKSSTYYEVLQTRGEGVHNVVFEVENFDAARARFKALGIDEWNSGVWGEVEFINFDTRGTLAVVAEIYRVAPEGAFPPPEAVYPPAE
jgi:hypothetical protein